MITIQHSLATLIHCQGDMEQFKKEIAYALLPDGIRAITGARQTSHFEKSSDGQETSYMKYPLDLKNFNKEVFNDTETYLSSNITPCCIGEETDINKFEETNTHLPVDYYNGVLMHLIQDHKFDEFVRQVFDCSDKYNDTFKFNGEEIDGKQLRSKIADLEMQGFYVLAQKVFNKYNIVANQDWFDKNVKSVLDEIYPSELAESTYKYMKIDEKINELITNIDFSQKYDFIVAPKLFSELYEEMIVEMDKADYRTDLDTLIVNNTIKEDIKNDIDELSR